MTNNQNNGFAAVRASFPGTRKPLNYLRRRPSSQALVVPLDALLARSIS